MVFHVMDRLVGNFGKPEEYFSDHRYAQLIQEGFSQEEAKQLTWFYSRSTHGKIVGFLGGVGTVYFMDPYYKSLMKVFPRLYYQPWIGLLLKLGVVYAGLVLGDYVATSRREGANMWLSNLYNNNLYISSKDAFIRNFETLNRKFTEEEIEKFHLQKGTSDDWTRKWIYNPYVYGEDEAAFKAKVQQLKNKTPPHDVKEVKEKIFKMNEEKIKHGESVILKPYVLTDNIDKTGTLTGLDSSPLLNHFRPLN